MSEQVFCDDCMDLSSLKHEIEQLRKETKRLADGWNEALDDFESVSKELEEIKLAAIESLKNTGGTGKGTLWEIIYGNTK